MGQMLRLVAGEGCLVFHKQIVDRMLDYFIEPFENNPSSANAVQCMMLKFTTQANLELFHIWMKSIANLYLTIWTVSKTLVGQPLGKPCL